MDRRHFLQSAALSIGVSIGTGPLILHASDKAGTKRPTVGSGNQRFECFHDWGTLPASIKWQTTHGIAIDSAGLVYVTHQGYGKDVMDTVVVFDADGKFVRSFGREYHQGGHGIDVRKEVTEEFLYLSDIHNRQVVKTTLKGEVVWARGFPTEAGVYKGKEQYRPTNVAFHPEGGFFVADGYGLDFIHYYDKEGKWVLTFSGNGTGDGKCRTPHGIWLDNRPGREPLLVVADRANARLQYFTLAGKFHSVVKDVLFPAGFDTRGDVLLVPDLHARVTLLGKDNAVLAHLGDDADWIAEVKKMQVRRDPSRWRAGRFVHPHDACFDTAGNIFVAEWVETGRLTFLRSVS
jgi:hypothetical protein